MLGYPGDLPGWAPRTSSSPSPRQLAPPHPAPPLWTARHPLTETLAEPRHEAEEGGWVISFRLSLIVLVFAFSSSSAALAVMSSVRGGAFLHSPSKARGSSSSLFLYVCLFCLFGFFNGTGDTAIQTGWELLHRNPHTKKAHSLSSPVFFFFFICLHRGMDRGGPGSFTSASLYSRQA